MLKPTVCSKNAVDRFFWVENARPNPFGSCLQRLIFVHFREVSAKPLIIAPVTHFETYNLNPQKLEKLNDLRLRELREPSDIRHASEGVRHLKF